LQQKKIFCAPIRTIDFILEGGSIESNGIDTVLTTGNCLLGKNRNNLDKQKIETLLKKHLHAEQVLWLKHGHLQGDDTDSHIDNLARFVTPDTIAYLSCDNTADVHYSDLREMQFELGRFRQTNGEPYRLLPLPLPAPCYSQLDGRRLPASYLNFLIINDAVLVPEFNCDTDQIAQQTLQQCFPDRTIIVVNSQRFIEQNGGIHCLTMQLPVQLLNKDR
jgi:agmatine/peptidylarginine deiminase